MAIRPNSTTHDKHTNSNIQCNEQTAIKQKWRKILTQMTESMKSDSERELGNKCIFVWLGKRGNLFVNLSRVVMEGSRGLGKRLERQDEASWTDFSEN